MISRPFCRVLGTSLILSATVWAGAGTGAYFRMVPVQPQGANAEPYPAGTVIDETAGTISFAGTGPQRVWLEVRYNWWETSMRFYQFSTVDLPANSGGLLQKAIEPCTLEGPGEDDRCRGLFGEGPIGGQLSVTGCRQVGAPPGTCIMAFPQWVDGDFRADFVTDLSIFAAAVYTGRIQAGQVADVDDECAVDDQTEKYSATLVVETTAAVPGPTDIPVEFDQDPNQSFMGDCGNVIIPISTMTGAVIQFRDDLCTSDAQCEDQDPCTTDTCDLSTGICESTPIPGCPAEASPFTYEGALENPPGVPVTDLCAFRFGLWNDAIAGALVDVTYPLDNPLTLSDVDVVEGAFTAVLDYGPDALNGDPRWLEIEVQCSGDQSFVMLSPRTPLLPVPYAIRALEGVGPPSGLNVTSAGLVGIGLDNPAHPLQLASGAHVTSGGVWTNACSQSLKENFADVNPMDILSRLVHLPVQVWNYRNEDETVRHVAPTAEAFHAAFGLGGSDKHIGTIDAEGIALAAIQGLNELLQEKDCAIEELQVENRALELRLRAIESTIAELERGEKKENEQ